MHDSAQHTKNYDPDYQGPRNEDNNMSEWAWLKDVGPTASVAIVAIILIVRQSTKFSETLLELQKARAHEVSNFSDGVIALVGLAITMANRCQSRKSTKDITPEEIINAGQEATNVSRELRERSN